MPLSYDCMAWEALTQAQRHASSIKNFEAVDLLENEMKLLASKIMNDPRRESAVRQDCPRSLAEIQARAHSATAAAQIADPTHDGATLATWLTTMPEETLAQVEKALKAEVAARKKAKTKTKTKKA